MSEERGTLDARSSDLPLSINWVFGWISVEYLRSKGVIK